MEEIKNEQQELVMALLGQSGIVSASAGSGKTRTLIKKILSYIQSGTSVENILALTFTNQAANEMKQRLVLELEKFIAETQRIELLDQLELVSQANISTFHSFYEKIVKKYFYIVGIMPTFKILDEQENNLFKEQAFSKAISNFKQKNLQGFLDLCDVLGKKRKDDAIKQRIFKLENFLSSQFNSERWTDETAKTMFKNQDEMLQNFFGEYFALIRQTQKDFEQILREANNDEEICSFVNKSCSVLNELLKCDYKTFFNSICEGVNFPKTYSKKTRNIELLEKAKNVKENFLNEVKELKKLGTFEDIINSFQTCKQNVELLVDLYKDFKNLLNEKKFEENKFDFSDMEKFCYQILCNSQIQSEIQNQFDQIFVDEFQDINPIQYEILKKLCKENNVLYVGDAKQSIYAFRQSDVEIFSSVCRTFEKAEFCKFLLLTCNFRTNKKILDFANEIFRVLMTEKSCGIDYEKTSMFDGKSENDCAGSSVEIVGIVAPKQEKTQKIEKIYKIFETQRNFGDFSFEAKVVANKIENLLTQKIFDGKEFKEINFGDIAILLRSRSNLMFELTSLFSQRNIPFVVNDEINLLELKEARLVVSLLNVCVNRNDDENLAILLASPIGGLCYDELSKIKIQMQSKFFFECVEQYLNSNNDIIASKISKFFERLDELNFQIQTNGASRAIKNFFEEIGFFDYVLQFGKDNLQKLNQFFAYIEKTGLNFDLPKLCSHFEKTKEIKIPSLIKHSQNAITITTIHASKGLEFPVVVLAEAGKDLARAKSEKDDLRIDKNFGLALKNYNKTNRIVYESIFKMFIENNAKKKALAEDLRLLYVALTRAKNKLVVCGNVDDEIKEITTQTNLLFCKQSYMSFILGVLQNKKLCGVDVQIISSVEEKEQKFEPQQVDVSSLLYARNLASNFSYPNKQATTLALKTSVSEILTKFENNESVTGAIKSFSTGDHLTNFSVQEEGNFVHELIEKIDFNSKNLEKDVENELKTQNLSKTQKIRVANEVVQNVKIIKNLVGQNCVFEKEKEFMIFASPNEIFGEGSNYKILVQGRLDLIAIGEKVILIDYKNTNVSNEKVLIERYGKQLCVYAFAAEKALGRKVDEAYILSLKQQKLIKIK